MRNKTKHCTYTGNNTIKNQASQPKCIALFRNANRIKSVTNQHGNSRYPNTVLRSIRGIFHTGLINRYNIISGLCKSVCISTIGFIKTAEVLILYSTKKIFRSNNLCFSRLFHGIHQLFRPDIFSGILGHFFLILCSSYAKQMPSIAKQTIIRPIGCPSSHRRDRYKIY